MNRGEILDEAKQCVLKDRNQTCGDPEDNFRHIAMLWNNWLAMRKSSGPLTPTDVAIMMTLMKVARLVSSPEKADHWIDIAGYAACGGGIASAVVTDPKGAE